MDDYQFLLGDGYLGKRAAKIAREHGARLINYCEPGCSCGHGCSGDCRSNKRHWFTADNQGEPFDSRLATIIDAALTAARIKH